MAVPILRRNLISFFSNHNSSLLKSPFSLYFSTETAKQPLDAAAVSKFLIKKHSFSPAAAAQIAALSRLRNHENADAVLSFLKQIGFSNAQLEKIFKTSPHFLSSNLDSNIKRKFEAFQDLGFTSAEVVEIITRQSRLLNHSVPRISSSASALIHVFGSTAVAAKFLKASGAFLCDMESTLIPNVEFLKSCGVPMAQIVRLTTSPQLFLHKPENLKKFVEKADAMGSERGSKSFIYAVRAVSSMKSESWELKLGTLRELGYSEEDIMRAFRNSPKVFTCSKRKIRRVAEVLLETGRYDRAAIARTPCVFQYSIEKRLIPRLGVLRVLEKKGLIGNWPSIASMVLCTDVEFFERFVAPYLDEIVDEVGDSWSSFSRI
ncbi:hypothetical protein AAHA92_23573 [Salvia divinorum]|uniref:Uncharacterized protein n=1 Tax=Salvia divinorum TaxID=28513 RepID=A0ABD1GSD9_SALDI